MKSRIRITAIRRPFDPAALAEVLVEAALVRIGDESLDETPHEALRPKEDDA